MSDKYRYFSHDKCEFFPCHKNIDAENFNCLFCYCPLYNFSDCGGIFTLLDNGIKDCSQCVLPHKRDNYDYIISKLHSYKLDI